MVVHQVGLFFKRGLSLGIDEFSRRADMDIDSIGAAPFSTDDEVPLKILARGRLNYPPPMVVFLSKLRYF